MGENLKTQCEEAGRWLWNNRGPLEAMYYAFMLNAVAGVLVTVTFAEPGLRVTARQIACGLSLAGSLIAWRGVRKSRLWWLALPAYAASILFLGNVLGL